MHGARPLRSTRRLQNFTSTLPRWYKITNSAAAGQPTVISIYDEIGMFGVSTPDFLAELRTVSGDIELHLNSPGGDVFDGIAIYNNLRGGGRTVRVIVDGLAASAASFIAQAASPGMLEMAPHSQMMIHDGFAMVVGNAADLSETAALLDKASDNIASIYAERTGKPAGYWRGLMKAETWFSDSEAVAAGLADKIHGQEAPQDSWDLSVYDRFSNAAGHGPMKGTHSHPHPAYGDQGGDATHSHEHSHDGDNDHGHSHYDPDHDGDDDSSAKGDTDHDYVKPDGSPGPKAATATRWLNADKYKQADRDEMAKSGEAMPDGSYPIRDAEDLGNAIQAVGRGGADHDSIRQHIIKRAKALGLSSRIPDNWNADGSLSDGSSGSSSNRIDPGLLASVFTSALEGGTKV